MHLRRTKIIATLGPATDDPEALRALIEAGADILRINLSHGTHEEQAARAKQVRGVARCRTECCDYFCTTKMHTFPLVLLVAAIIGAKCDNCVIAYVIMSRNHPAWSMGLVLELFQHFRGRGMTAL